MTVEILRKPFRNFLHYLETLLSFLGVLLTTTISVELLRARLFHRLRPGLIGVIILMKRPQQVSFCAEIIKTFFVGDGHVRPLQALLQVKIVTLTKLSCFIRSLPRELAAAFHLRANIVQR